MSLSSDHENRLNRSTVLVLAGMAIISVGIYLLASRLYYRVGFPLDDAWIHQTYARNLALHGEWAFLPGKVSAGSTAPLWSGLLAVGYWLRLAPYAWTYLLGTISLWGISLLGERLVRKLVPVYQPRFPWVGAALALEWHLAWAAVSGMETILYALLVMAVIFNLVTGARRYFSLGLLIGLSAWVRPDGITLLGAAAVFILLVENTWTKRLRSGFSLGVGCGGLLALYLLFNLSLAGSPLPNTFYAKQAEYAVLRQIPYWNRLAGQALQPLIGVGIVLLPGVIIASISAARNRNWGVLASLAWFLGYLGLYAWSLPVTYQHGRYVIPAMPVLFVLGLAGLIEFARKKQKLPVWMIKVAWILITVMVLVTFWGRGAYAYAQDVAVIESEMVKTAKWVSNNLPPNALIAAHDIGALGYFGGHDLVDMAGLVSPEVIPFIRDEARLSAYLNSHSVDYLVTFPSWYRDLTRNLTPIYTTGSPYAPEMGEDNMAVYRWPRP